MPENRNQQTGLTQLKQALAPANWSTDPDIIAPYLQEWRERWHGHTPLLLLPRTCDEVVTAVKICAANKLAITPQGGNTGLVGGQIPQGEILLSTRMLNKVRHTDSDSITLEAGCILQNLHTQAEQMNQRFPLSLASQGSASIGGLCSTNAGGVHVVRYGSMRDLVLGLEVVLADGSLLSTLHKPKKDNTGYKLTPMFIGAEGTLGIITAAKLKLFPKPETTETIFVALSDVNSAIALYHLCKNELPDALSLIELVPERGLTFVTQHIANTRSPFNESYPWYVVIQFEFSQKPLARERIEALLETALNKGIVQNAVIAESAQQTQTLLALREQISAAQKPEGGSIKHDISVPIEAIPEFIQQASQAVELLIPGCRPLPFGHIGDGNIHFNVSQPLNMNTQEYLSHWEAMNQLIHNIVSEFNGSISAEHGIGILKISELYKHTDPVKLQTMQRIKRALDPDNIMNPRVLL